MFGILVDKVVLFLISHKLANSKYVEEYRYAFEVIFLKFMHILVILSIAMLYKKTMFICFFLLFFISIRKKIGGFHAKSRTYCLFISITISFLLCNLIDLYSNINQFVFFASVFLIICLYFLKNKFWKEWTFLFVYLIIFQNIDIMIFALFYATLFSVVLYIIGKF